MKKKRKKGIEVVTFLLVFIFIVIQSKSIFAEEDLVNQGDFKRKLIINLNGSYDIIIEF